MGNNKISQTAKQVLDATQEMRTWMAKHYSTLAKAIAKFAIFCSPEIFLGTPQKNYSDRIQFITIKKQGKSEPSLIRRAKHDETKRTYVNEGGAWVYLDDNTVINQKFKKLVQLSDCRNYMTCHIWDDVDIPEVFSCVANIVLLPTTISGLSDYSQEIKDLLMYRAYELYEWKPQNRSIPVKPADYDKLKWTYPAGWVPSKDIGNTTKAAIEKRLELWAENPAAIVYQTIAFVQAVGQIPKTELIEKLYYISNNPNMIIASLMTDAGNAYGSVLEYVDRKRRIIGIKECLRTKINELWK